MALRCFVWVNSFSALNLPNFICLLVGGGARPPAEFCRGTSPRPTKIDKIREIMAVLYG